jgi:hypothetical protein
MLCYATKEMLNFKYTREHIVNDKSKIRSGMFVAGVTLHSATEGISSACATQESLPIE